MGADYVIAKSGRKQSKRMMSSLQTGVKSYNRGSEGLSLGLVGRPPRVRAWEFDWGPEGVVKRVVKGGKGDVGRAVSVCWGNQEKKGKGGGAPRL